ncbi:MAG: RNA 2',3'-cyclic phosphodiesterase [Planctomycetes bacterium]|nr:RNA 2',3'-cyclic phosphodiesterase [Planctomycetota bacterium]
MAVRIFIAIEIEKRIKERILEFIKNLKNTDTGVRWVASDNLHLTVKFIGDVDPVILPSLIKSLDNVASLFRPFRLQIRNVGFFPTAERPRVLFVGLRDKENYLARIFEETEKAVEEFGIKRESRKFVGHITIGRTKSQKHIHRLKEAVHCNAERFFGQENVNHFSLIQSELTRGGPIYTTLKQFKLYEI